MTRQQPGAARVPPRGFWCLQESGDAENLQGSCSFFPQDLCPRPVSCCPTQGAELGPWSCTRAVPCGIMDAFQSLLLHPTAFTLLVSSLKITLQLSGARTWPSTNPSWGQDNQGLILLSFLVFKGLLSEINDPDSFLKDLLNSIP